MKHKPELCAYVDDAGHLVLPAEVALRYGLKPGSHVYLDERPNALSIVPPVTHLSRVYIEPTNRCNLECRTCIRNSWDEPLGVMTGETFAAIIEGIEAFDPRPSVFFGGFGEPLAHPDIVEMVARVKAAGARVELITNGTLLDRDASRRLIAAGLDMLWVSLDGATPESYADVRLGAALPEILANLLDFVEVRWGEGFPSSLGGPRGVLLSELGIVFVAMRRNAADLPAVVRLGNRLGAALLLVTNVLPYTPDMREEVLYRRSLTDRAFHSPSSYRVELPRIDIDGEGTGSLLWDSLSGRSVSMGGADLAEGSDRCPFVEKGATAVSWDGSLVPCLPLLHDSTSYLNSRARFSKRHIIGNVASRGLRDMWEDREYVAFRERVQQFDFSPCAFCGGCDLSERNEQDCVGNTFPTCGGCLWAQGIVQCP